jgi:hypothetical protein
MRHDKHRNSSGKLHNNHDDEQFVMLQEVSFNLNKPPATCVSQNIFSQELKKVLEEARQDEASMAALETELESSEQRLAEALEDSANLRAQLIDRSSSIPAEGHNHDLTVRHLLPFITTLGNLSIRLLS